MRISDWSSDVCSSDLRVVHTDQSSTSSLAVPGSATDRYISTIGDKYWTFLPSANFILDLSEQDRLRMSFSRQVSRARFFDMRNSIAFGLADIAGGVYQPRGSGGNPMPRPYPAKQVDSGYAPYFGPPGVDTAGRSH